MVNTLQRLILVDEGGKGQLSDIVEKLVIRHAQVTDKLRGYGVACRELIPDTIHSNQQYADNRAEQSH
jgi:transposase-like protein